MDPKQVSYLDEECIVVDRRDSQIGSASKRKAHNWAAIQRGECLHRAFSVFLFNPEGKMLLQQRSKYKITFPEVWTNACCSHPLNRPDERTAVEGVITAAKRKLTHELGFTAEELEPLTPIPLSRILYKAQCPPPQEEWGEHELDHVLFLTHFCLPLRPNFNEVAETKWVDRKELDELLGGGPPFSPWFRLIAREFLPAWWDNLNSLAHVQDYHDRIHEFD